MKKCLKFLAVVTVFFSASFAAQASSNGQVHEVFTDAVKAYHAKQYDVAIRLNESILAQGFFSTAIFYNLGNAHFKSGHLGRAVLYYVRAQVIDPRDSDVRANLLFVRSLVENYVPWSSNPLFKPPQRFFSSRELLWISSGILALTGGFLLAGLYGGMRRKRLVLGVVSGLVFSVYFIGAWSLNTVSHARMAVCVHKADARFEPNDQATLYFTVPEGAEVRILRINKDGWAKVQRSDLKTGWVIAASIERI